MPQTEITKEFIDNIVAYRDQKLLHQNGSVLILLNDIKVSPQIMEYAKSQKLEIQFDPDPPRQFNMDAGYLS